MTAAARQRSYRARARAGRMVISVEVDDTAVAQALADAGLLSPAQIDDREAIAAALERLIETVARNDAG